MGARAARRLGAGMVLILTLAVPAGRPGAEDLARALGALGSPGLLWGRLAAEEESPDGPWTPLAGVEVVVYPYLPEVLADLEQVRQSARESGRQFETAPARVQGVLRGYKKRLEGGGPEGAGLVRRQVTDPMGVFVFEDLPSGEWLLVATRVTPYAATAGRESRKRVAGRESRFLGPSGRVPAQEAEMWVVRVPLGPGERRRLLLSDRARWLTGPLR